MTKRDKIKLALMTGASMCGTGAKLSACGLLLFCATGLGLSFATDRMDLADRKKRNAMAANKKTN